MAAIQAQAQWTDSFPETEIGAGSMRTWKHSDAQLVIGRALDGSFFALDNRCPHEGYPLAQGDLKDSTLTCCWHNWKFDVRDGCCLKGGENVRRFPVRTRNGIVQVDLAPPAPNDERQRLRASLEAALTDADLDRALRDSVRLLRADHPIEQLLGDVALHDAEHAEYGATHTLALAAETAELLRSGVDVPVANILAPLLELAGDSNQRLPRRQRPPAVGGAHLDCVRQAVEAEDLEAAEGAILGAYAEGRSRREVESCLFDVCADHFLSFGHGLIYLIKLRQLLDELPDSFAPPLHASLLFYMGNATREDTLPYMRAYFTPVRQWATQFDALPAWRDRAPRHQGLPRSVEAAVLDGKRPEAMQSVWDALQAGYSPPQVAQSLVLAAARRLLRFDLHIDADPSVQEGWLFATHRLTFASATRLAQLRFESPRALHYLFQAAAFIHSGAPMDAQTDLDDGVPPGDTSSLQQLQESILGRNVSAAMSQLAAQMGEAPLDPSGHNDLIQALHQCALDATLVRPIFRVHAIKTLLAGIEETVALASHTSRALPLAAAVRFLASPVQEERSRAAAYSATEWVEHGRMIRKLTQ